MHLPRILADYPNAEGVLWVSDGMALNYWAAPLSQQEQAVAHQPQGSFLAPPLPPNATAASFPPGEWPRR